MAVSDLSRASCFSRTPSEYIAYLPTLPPVLVLARKIDHWRWIELR
jgi:hypothetical protein